jgi:hypothetical protein
MRFLLTGRTKERTHRLNLAVGDLVHRLQPLPVRPAERQPHGCHFLLELVFPPVVLDHVKHLCESVSRKTGVRVDTDGHLYKSAYHYWVSFLSNMKREK